MELQSSPSTQLIVVPPVEIYAPGEGEVFVTVNDPFKRTLRQHIVPSGSTIDEIVNQCLDSKRAKSRAVVYIEGEPLYTQSWKYIRPKPGKTVSIQLMPGKMGGGGGGGSQQIFQIIGLIAMVIVSIWFPYLAPVLAVVLAAGNFLIAKLSGKPKTGGMDQMTGSNKADSATVSVTGTQNEARPYSVVPRLLGRHKIVPPYGALPITEIKGADQYCTVVFCLGLGPLKWDPPKLGDTLLSKFLEVETEFRRGYQPEHITDMGSWDPNTAYPVSPQFGYHYTCITFGQKDGRTYFDGDTITYNNLSPATSIDGWDYNQLSATFKLRPIRGSEQSLQILMEQDLKEVDVQPETDWQLRTTRPDTNRISVDISFLQGLVYFLPEGGKAALTVKVQIRWAPVGTTTWTYYELDTTAKQASVVRNTYAWDVPLGTYDVELRRLSRSDQTSSGQSKVWWTALRSFGPGPIIRKQGLCIHILKLKATNQINGIVDNYNLVAQSILPEYDVGTDTWKMVPTSNNASIYREVLSGNGLGTVKLPIERLSEEFLEDASTWSRSEGYEFNQMVDYDTNVGDLLDAILTTMRASRAIMNDGTWGGIIDRPQGAPVHKYTARNIWDFGWVRPFPGPRLPNIILCRFINADMDWRQDERQVQSDTFDPDNPVYLTLEFAGVTNPAIIYKLCRFWLAQLVWRAIDFKWTCGLEYVLGSRGTLVALQHSAIVVGLGAGRITELVTDGGGNITYIRIDEAVRMEFGRKYAISINADTNPGLARDIYTDPDNIYLLRLIDVIAPTDDQPAEGDIVTFGVQGIVEREVLIKSVEPQSKFLAQLAAEDYAPIVYTADTEEIPPFTSNLSPLPGVGYPPIENARSNEEVLVILPDHSWQLVIDITLGNANAPVSANGIELRYRPSGLTGPYQFRTVPVSAGTVLLTNVEQSVTYDIEARYTTTAQPGGWGPIVMHTVEGPRAPPADITEVTEENGFARWVNYVPPIDILGYRVRYLIGDNFNYNAGIHAHTEDYITAKEFNLSLLPSGTITLMIKAIDIAFNESVNAIGLILDLGDPLTPNIYDTIDLDTLGFPGTKVDCSVVGGDLVADIESSDPYLPIGSDPYLADGAAAYLADTYQAMVYTYAMDVVSSWPPLDLVYAPTIVGNYHIDYSTLSGLPYASPDGSAYASPDGDPYAPSSGSTPSWQPWPGRVTIDHAWNQYSLRVSIDGGAIQGKITNADILLDGDEQFDQLYNVAIGSGGTTLTLNKSFASIKQINFTVLNATQAKTLTVDHPIDPVSPVVHAYNTAGATTATVNIELQGVKGA